MIVYRFIELKSQYKMRIDYHFTHYSRIAPILESRCISQISRNVRFIIIHRKSRVIILLNKYRTF